MKQRLYDLIVEQDGVSTCVEIDLPLDKATRMLEKAKAAGWKASLKEVVRDECGNLVIAGRVYPTSMDAD